MGRGRSKQFVWTVYVSRSGKTTIELPRWVRQWAFSVEDLPGVPAGSNYSDPSIVEITITRTRRWRADLATLSWNVPVQKLVILTLSR